MNTYNGWTNRETWLVNLWFEESFDSYVQDSGCDLSASVASELVESVLPESGGFLGDVLSTFLGNVDWFEIASHYKAEES